MEANDIETTKKISVKDVLSLVPVSMGGTAEEAASTNAPNASLTDLIDIGAPKPAVAAPPLAQSPPPELETELDALTPLGGIGGYEAPVVDSGLQAYGKRVGIAGKKAFNQKNPDPLAYNFLTGGKAHELVKEVDELVTDPRVVGKVSGDALKTLATLMFIGDDATKVDIVKNIFKLPDEAIQQDKYGTIVVTFPDGYKSVLNKPGASVQDAVSFIGATLPFLATGGVAGAMEGVVASSLGRAALRGLMASATEYGLQKAGQAAGGTQPVDPVNIAAAGLGELGAQYAGRKIKQVKDAKKADLLGASLATPEDIPHIARNVAEADKITDATGLILYRPEKTLVPSDIARRRALAKYPVLARRSTEALEAQNASVRKAVDTILDKIAPASASQTAEVGARKAASSAIEHARDIRRQATKKLYKEAFQDTKFYKAAKTRAALESRLADLPPGDTLTNQFEKIKKMLTVKRFGKTISRGYKLKQLDKTQQAIRRMADAVGLPPEQKSKLMDIRGTLLKEIDSFNPKYKAARTLYREMSPAVDKVSESLVGTIAGLKDKTLDSVVPKLFDPKKPTATRYAKKLIEARDPAAWDAITRRRLETVVSGLVSETPGTGIVPNTPRKLWTELFGTKGARDVTYGSVSPEIAKRFKYLEKGLSRMMATRPARTAVGATASDIEKEARSGVISTLFNFLGKIRDTTGAGLRNVTVGGDKKIKAWGDVMLNPKWNASWETIYKLDPTRPGAGRKLRRMLTAATATGQGARRVRSDHK